MQLMPRWLLRGAIRAGYYPSLWFSRLMTAAGIWRWWDEVDEHVIIGAVPSRADLARLRELGVGAVVNMCEEFAGHQDTLSRHGLDQLCLPTLDYHPPSESDIRRGIRFMLDHAAAGRKIYVHCKAGRGRSATLVLCYLMAAHGWTATQAYGRLKSARPHVTRGLSQRAVVSAIERSVRSGE